MAGGGLRYLTDTGRNWGGRHSLRDTMPGAEPVPVETTDDLIRWIESGEAEGLYLTVHPERWAVSEGGVGCWVREGYCDECRKDSACGDAIMVEIVQQVPEDEWRVYLERSSNATLYHTPEWKAFLEKTFGYESRYLFATDESGRLIGMLPLFEVRSRLTGNRLCSVPFSHECGCLGNDIAGTALIEGAITIKDKQHIEKSNTEGLLENADVSKKNDILHP